MLLLFKSQRGREIMASAAHKFHGDSHENHGPFDRVEDSSRVSRPDRAGNFYPGLSSARSKTESFMKRKLMFINIS